MRGVMQWDGSTWSAAFTDAMIENADPPAVEDGSGRTFNLLDESIQTGQHVIDWIQPRIQALRAVAISLSVCAQRDLGGSSTCMPCPPGTFTKEYSNGARECVSCPANTYNAATFSATSADCLACPAGQGSDTGSTACSTCPAGTYADAAGEGCKECPAGTSSALIGATASSTCEPCAKGLYQSLAGQSTCEACAIGTTTASTGLTSCDDCAANAFTPQAGEQCYACGALQGGGWYRLDGASATQTWGAACAQCAKGSATNSTDATACSPCGAGTYADAVGAAQCTECPAGTFVAGAGSTSAGDCAACGSGRTSVAGASACTDCAAGTYGPSGINPECEPCPANTFGDSDGAVSCTDCPAGASSPAGSTSASACACADPLMSANVVSGSLVCACPAGTEVDGLSCACACPTNAKLNAAGVACVCMAGYEGALETPSDACAPCGEGRYKPTNSSDAMEDCACPAHSALVDGACVCDAGYTNYLDAPGDQCSECAAGSYKNASGPFACAECPPRSSSPAAATSLAACACADPMMVAETINGVLTCACPAGTRTTASDTCVQCELGTYTDRGGLDECRACPAGATTQRLGATAADECACPPNSALVADRCVCLAGFEGTLLQPGDACAACGIGTFKADRDSGACAGCPRGASTADVGATARSDCVCPAHSSLTADGASCECDAGYTGVLNERGDECVPCAIGSFKPLPGPALCDVCPPGATTADVAALSDAECQCVPGSYPEWAAGGGEMSCSSCPTGANCSSGGAPSGMAGYWRENMSSPVFYSCPFPTACLPEHAPRGHGGGGEGARAASSSASRRALLEAGLEDAADSSWRCDYGYDGMLCAVCEPGYGYSESDGCSSCQASGSVWVGAVAAILALALVVVLLYWLPFLPRLAALVSGALKRMASFYEAFANGDNLKKTQLGRKLSREASETVAETAESVERRLERSSAAAHARVLIAFVQVVATVDVTFDIPWPKAFLDMVKALKVINLDVLALPSARCSLETWDFFDKLWLWLCAPAAFGVATLLLYAAGRLYAGGDEALRPRLARFRANVWRNSLFALFLVYPILSATLLRTFHCREVDGARWLSSDLRLRCDTAAHERAEMLASVGIALYVAGIPLFFLLAMLRHGVPAIAARHRSRAVARNALLVGIALNEDADEVDAVLGMEMRRLLRERATLEQLFEGEVRVGTRLAQTLAGDGSENAQRPGGDTPASPQSKTAGQGEDGPASPRSGKASRAASFAADDGAAREALVAWAAAHAPVGELCFGAKSSASARGAAAGTAVGTFLVGERLADDINGPLDADEALAMRHCGQLFASYHTECWYWELVELLRKLVLTGALVFVDAGGSGQIAVGLLVACFFLVANLALSPFADAAVDRSAQAALVEIALILFAGLLVKVETVGGTNDRRVIGALLVVTSGMVFAIPVLSAVLEHGAAARRAARTKLSKLRSARVATSASQKAGEGEEDEGKVDEGAAGDTAAPSPEP
eukprot:PRCOL_00005509-RA